MKTKKHNGVISIWKFIFAICILLHHTKYIAPTKDVVMEHMAIGVEFFFIVSGFLLAVSALNKKSSGKGVISETWSYIFNKIRKVYPHVLIGSLLFLVIAILKDSHNLYTWILSLWSFTLVHVNGLGNFIINTPVWYISAMLLAMLIIYPFIRKYKTKYSRYIAPVIVIFLSGIMYRNYHTLHNWSTWIGFCYYGTLRAFLSINIGIVLYEICEKIKKINFTFFARFLLTITEISLLTTSILAQEFLEKGRKLDFFWLLFFAVGILIAFSEKTLFYKACCNKFFYYLEKLSLPIYLNQLAVLWAIGYFNFFNRFTYTQNILISIGITIYISIYSLKLVDLWDKYKDKILGFLKKLIIKNEEIKEN